MDEESTIDVNELQTFIDQQGDIPTLRVAGVLLAHQGIAKNVVAAAFGVSVKTVYNWVNRFQKKPVKTAAYDESRPGAPPKLTSEERGVLLDSFRKPPSEIGIESQKWTPKVAQDYIQKRFGVSYSKRHVRRILREASSNRE